MKTESKIVLSVLDLAGVREGGTVSESFRNTVKLAQAAEAWGYRRFWLAEHHNMAGIASAATSVLIGHVAGATSSIRVGSGGIMLPNHAPLVIAEQFGTLEALYPGRIDLGLGRAVGGDAFTAQVLGRSPNAGDHFPELVQELIRYLGPVSPHQRIQAVPGSNSNVPVWLLGSSTFSAHLAATLGLPFAFAGQFAPRLLLDAIELYREFFKPSAALSQPYVMVGLPVVAADSDQQAAYLATSARQRILRLIRGQPIFTPPPVRGMDGLWNLEEQQAVEAHLGAAVIGGPAAVKQKLLHFLKLTSADEFMLYSDFYRLEDRLRSYEIVAGLFLKPTIQNN
jgi:luciferase family oxidoreductase group 1